MTPDNLRKLSWWTFKATIYCGIAGIVLLAAVPNSSFRSASDTSVGVLAVLAFTLAGLAGLANLISLISGTIAWSKGAKSCRWIFICAIVLLFPLGLWVATW